MKHKNKLCRIRHFIVFGMLLVAVKPAVLFAQSSSEHWDSRKVLGAEACENCHKYAVDIWMQTSHFKGFRTMRRTKQGQAIAAKLGIDKLHIRKPGSICTECHYTPGKNITGGIKVAMGVSCESCHGPADDWLDIHRAFGKGVRALRNESNANRKERHKELLAVHMIFPGNFYGIARNCLACHMIANESIVNKGGHPTSKDFDVAGKSFGALNHIEIQNIRGSSHIKKLGIAGTIVQMELSLKALSQTTPGSTYAKEMEKMANSAARRMEFIAFQINDPNLQNITGLIQDRSFKAGDTLLVRLADRIGVLAIKALGVDGTLSQKKRVKVKLVFGNP